MKKMRNKNNIIWLRLITFLVITTFLCQNIVLANPRHELNKDIEHKLAPKSLFNWIKAHSENQNIDALASKKRKTEELDKFLRTERIREYIFNPENKGQFPSFGEIEAIIENFLLIPFGEKFKYSENKATIKVKIDGHDAALSFFKDPSLVTANPKLGIKEKDIPLIRERGYWFERDIRSEVRSIIFRHQDGIAIAPTMHALNEKGVFKLFENDKEVELDDVVKQYGGNEGYIGVALNLLVAQGWLDTCEKGRTIKYKLTSSGKIALEMSAVYTRATSFIPEAINIYEYLFDVARAPPKASLLQELVDLSKKDWDLPEETDPLHQVVREQILYHLNGMLIGPVMATLGVHNIFDFFDSKTNQLDIDILWGNKEYFKLVFDLLEVEGWAERKDNIVTLTEKGVIAIKLASAYGVTVSYLPTFNIIPQLLFGEPSEFPPKRDESGNETWVNRVMNVWGSGGAHTTYFKKIDEIIIEIFNRPFEEQPKGIADMGCGDGTFLKHLYKTVMEKTKRGDLIRQDPEKYGLLIVGADYNKESREKTIENLIEAGISHIVVPGNINDPDDFAETLKEKHDINLEDLLSVRSFLDHNRPYTGTTVLSNKRPSSSVRNYAHNGRRIPPEELQQNLVEHFRRWEPYIGKYGLLVLESHGLDPRKAKTRIGKTLATPYDATHGFSDQYNIHLEEFLDAVREAGLIPCDTFHAKFPPNEFATISINHFKAPIKEADVVREIEFCKQIPKTLFTLPGTDARNNLIDTFYETLEELSGKADKPILIEARGESTFLRSDVAIDFEMVDNAEFVLSVPRNYLERGDFAKYYRRILIEKFNKAGLSIESLTVRRKRGSKQPIFNVYMEVVSEDGYRLPVKFRVIPVEALGELEIENGGINLIGSYYGNSKGEEMLLSSKDLQGNLHRLKMYYKAILDSLDAALDKKEHSTEKISSMYKKLIYLSYINNERYEANRLLKLYKEHLEKGDLKEPEVLKEIRRHLWGIRPIGFGKRGIPELDLVTRLVLVSYKYIVIGDNEIRLNDILDLGEDEQRMLFGDYRIRPHIDQFSRVVIEQDVSGRPINEARGKLRELCNQQGLFIVKEDVLEDKIIVHASKDRPIGIALHERHNLVISDREFPLVKYITTPSGFVDEIELTNIYSPDQKIKLVPRSLKNLEKEEYPLYEHGEFDVYDVATREKIGSFALQDMPQIHFVGNYVQEGSNIHVLKDIKLKRKWQKRGIETTIWNYLAILVKLRHEDRYGENSSSLMFPLTGWSLTPKSLDFIDEITPGSHEGMYYVRPCINAYGEGYARTDREGIPRWTERPPNIVGFFDLALNPVLLTEGGNEVSLGDLLLSSDSASRDESIEDITEYTYDESLGRDLEVNVVVKGFKQDEIVRKIIERKGAKQFGLTSADGVRAAERKYSDGVIFKTNLDIDNFDGAVMISSTNQLHCPEPFGIASYGTKIAYTAGYKLIIVDTATGEEKELEHDWISFLHTVTFSEDGSKVLVSSAGLDTLLELDIETGEATWQWTTWDHGFNYSKVTGECVVRDREHASRLARNGNSIIFVRDPNDWPKEGIPTVQSPTRLNGGFYGEGGTILATCYHRPELILVNRDGSHEMIDLGLQHPHSFMRTRYPYHDGYIVTDTGAGEFLFLDKEFKPTRKIVFSSLPAETWKKQGFGEWIQNVTPIYPENGIFAAVDALRDGVHIFDVKNKTRRFIKNHPNWTIQGLFPVEGSVPSSVDRTPLDENVTCGTVVATGHGQLNQQIRRLFGILKEIWKRWDVLQNEELNHHQADITLKEYAKECGHDVRYDDLKGYRERIKEACGIPEDIGIFFFIPEDGTDLFWVKDPRTGKWTYSGGHYSSQHRRIHISLPIILKQGIDAGVAIARHDWNHINGLAHDDNDPGMQIVNNVAESERQKISKLGDIWDFIRGQLLVYEGIDSYPYTLLRKIKPILVERLINLENGADYYEEDRATIEQFNALGFTNDYAITDLLLRTKARPDKDQEVSLEEYIEEGDYIPIYQYFLELYKYPNENTPHLVFRAMGKRYRVLSMSMRDASGIVQDIKEEVIKELLFESRRRIQSGLAFNKWNSVQKRAVTFAQEYLDRYFEERYGFSFPVSLEEVTVFVTLGSNYERAQGKICIAYSEHVEGKKAPDEIVPKLIADIIHEALHMVLPYSFPDFYSLVNLDEGFITSETLAICDAITRDGGKVEPKGQQSIYAYNIDLYRRFEEIVGRDTVMNAILQEKFSPIFEKLGPYGAEVMELLEYVQVTKVDRMGPHGYTQTECTDFSHKILNMRSDPVALLKFIKDEEKGQKRGHIDWDSRNKKGTIFDPSFKLGLLLRDNDYESLSVFFDSLFADDDLQKPLTEDEIQGRLKEYAELLGIDLDDGIDLSDRFYHIHEHVLDAFADFTLQMGISEEKLNAIYFLGDAAVLSVADKLVAKRYGNKHNHIYAYINTAFLDNNSTGFDVNSNKMSHLIEEAVVISHSEREFLDNLFTGFKREVSKNEEFRGKADDVWRLICGLNLPESEPIYLVDTGIRGTIPFFIQMVARLNGASYQFKTKMVLVDETVRKFVDWGIANYVIDPSGRFGDVSTEAKVPRPVKYVGMDKDRMPVFARENTALILESVHYYLRLRNKIVEKLNNPVSHNPIPSDVEQKFIQELNRAV